MAALALYGLVPAMQPIPEFGRVYAAYGGVLIALAPAQRVFIDGFRPDRYDLLGALVCITGVLIMVLPAGGQAPRPRPVGLLSSAPCKRDPTMDPKPSTSP